MTEHQDDNTLEGLLEDNRELRKRLDKAETQVLFSRTGNHELRNALHGIQMIVEYWHHSVLKRTQDADEVTIPREHLESVCETIRHCTEMNRTRSHLLKKGSINYTSMPVDTKKVILQTMKMVLPEFKEKGFTISYAQPDIEGNIYYAGDKLGLRLALLNIYRNALEAFSEDNDIVSGEKKGEVITRVFKRSEDSYVHISVENNGPPVPDQKDIFDDGFTTKERGTGTGLALCKNIIEEVFGGKIDAYNTLKGVKFHIRLPESEPPNEPVTSTPPQYR